MPVGVIVHPMGDEAHGRTVPLITLGPAGIIRCRKCRTYMNPFIQWTDSGRRCAIAAMNAGGEEQDRQCLYSGCKVSIEYTSL